MSRFKPSTAGDVGERPFPFASRTNWSREENRWSRRLAEVRASGRPLFDLTESNPTRCGLRLDVSTSGAGDLSDLVGMLGHPRGARYEPLAQGHPEAREAVCRYYAERGIAVRPERVLLSASTSEAYSWLFKLLVEPGQRVLVPQPSYPLFSYLADLEDVELTPYFLRPEEAFRIDFDSIMQTLERDSNTAALLLVHPNNPTGTFCRRDEAVRLRALAAERGLALIVDEVFGDYAWSPLRSDRLPSFAGEDSEALTFVLSGLSKVLAAPQLKLGWMLASGPERWVDEALARLELVADTYLSVSTPVQLALSGLLGARGSVQSAVRGRIEDNLRALDVALAGLAPTAPVRRRVTDGGWCVSLEIPRTRDEEEWVELLLCEEGVVVQPGYFFDMPGQGVLVVSLLPEPSVFRGGIERLLRRVAEA